MRLLKITILFAVGLFTSFNMAGQTANASLNIVTLNSGQVYLTNIVDVQVTVGNTGPGNIAAFKVRAQISVPSAIALPLPNAQQTGLPLGWTITVNSGGSITVCNGTDVIPPNTQRQIFIKVQGNALGGPSTINGSLLFSNGTSCTIPGTLNGDNVADNTATTSIQVIPVPSCNLTVTASAGAIPCAGGTTTLTATAANANGLVEYSITGGAPFQTSNTFTVSAGTYTVTTREIYLPSCVATATPVTISNPAVVTAPVTGTIIQPSCTTPTGSVDLSGLPPGNWTITSNPAGISASGSGTSTVITGLTPATTYTFIVTNAAGCISPASSNVIINGIPGAPAAPAVTVTQPSCTAATGTIAITSSTSGLIFSLDGAAYAAYPAGGYTVAAGPHTLTAQNAGNCISPVTNITVNAQPPTPAAPTAGTITQPSCTITTGSVDLNGLPAGNWTINPGAFTGNTTSTTISGLTPGTYNFTVTNAAGCTSSPSADIIINNVPAAPAAPTVNLVQPTCTTATGTITITSTTAGLTFSLDGAAYAAYPVGGYTVVTGPHTLTAQNATACISPVTTITINAQPPAPAAPTVSVVQPTCTTAAGAITITSATSGLTFSLDGTAYAAYPVGGYTAASGPHTLTAQNASGCISAVTNITVDVQPATPAIPIVGTITQPTCAVSGGSVDLSGLPAGTWTINPGAITGNTTNITLNNLTAGTYNFTVTNAVGCTSPATADVVIDNVPGAPPAPTVNVVQPTCAVTSGIITITSSTTGLTFSLDGGPFATYPAGGYSVAAGTHTLMAQNIASCQSPITTITVNAPVIPAAPAVSVVQPDCTVATGTITITSVTTGLTFSLDGATYAAYPAGGYTAIAAGPHTLTAQNASFCISPVTTIIINAQPATPSAPIAGTIIQPTCAVTTGSVVLNGLPAGNWTINPGAITGNTTSTTINGLTPATYNFTVTNAAGCTSTASANIIIASIPAPPASPTINVVQPTCTIATGTISITSATTGLTFSIDGAPYTAYPAGGYIVAAGPHTLTAQNASFCISAVTSITVNAPPATPAAPVVSIVQPTCTTATGTITITSSTTGLTFSLDGSSYGPYPAGGYTAAAGPHTITAQNAAGCISAITNCNVNAQPPTPAAPVVNVIQPNCTIATATITVTSATAGLTFSFDGAAYAPYPAGGYTAIAAGPHTLTAQNTSTCISPLTNITVNVQPSSPSATVAVGTIACNGGTAILTATANGGTSPYQFSLNGGTFQSANTFTISAGTYTITVKDANGCIGNAAPITVTQPALLTANATAGRIVNCGGTTVVTVTAAGGTAPYQFQGGGTGAYTRGPGTWSFTVTDARGCTASKNIIIEAPGCVALKVYPNPANSTINVNHSVAAAGSYMQVVNANGAVVLSKSVTLNAFLTAIDISRLAAGPYVIVYWNGKEKKAIVFDKIPSN